MIFLRFFTALFVHQKALAWLAASYYD